jgi:prepilin-type N-terminal cleavage/methylation domain-containing protein
MNASTKTSKSKKSRGFTLVEMLVVIGMIAALAGVSFPVYRSIQKKVEKQQVQMMFTSIERAVDDFETEYNHLPYAGSSYPTADATHYWDNPVLGKIFGVLMGLESSQNFKKIEFLEIQLAEGSGPAAAPGPAGYKNGVVVDGDTATLYGPHGVHYAGCLDHDMDGDTYCNTLPETVIGKKIIFWTPNFPAWNKTKPDWIKSWEY